MKRLIVLVITVVSLLGMAAPPAEAWGNCTLYHRVHFGETLASIARFYGTSFPYLASINNLSNPNFIFAGELLCVRVYNPPPQQTTYVVQRGDWLALIARRFNVSLAALLQANPLMNPNFIFPGEVLIIPTNSYGVQNYSQPSQPYAPPMNNYGGGMNQPLPPAATPDPPY